MRRAALEVQDITVRFGGIRALTEVSLTLDPAGICGLIGPNGAGKTTLFDVVSGIRRPDRGRVLLDGADITHRSPVWRARHGMRRTFQRHQLFGQLTVLDNLLVAQEWRGRGHEKERGIRAEHILSVCGLEAVADSYAGTLPTGQARMAELARAIVDPPRVLLLDEPASGMTADESAALASVVRRLAEDEGCAVLLVEHNVAFVMELCTRVVVLDLGTVLATGTAAEVRADPKVRAAYLGTAPAG